MDVTSTAKAINAVMSVAASVPSNGSMDITHLTVGAIAAGKLVQVVKTKFIDGYVAAHPKVAALMPSILSTVGAGLASWKGGMSWQDATLAALVTAASTHMIQNSSLATK